MRNRAGFRSGIWKHLLQCWTLPSLIKLIHCVGNKGEAGKCWLLCKPPRWAHPSFKTLKWNLMATLLLMQHRLVFWTYECTLLAHVQYFIHQLPQTLLARAVLSVFITPSLLVLVTGPDARSCVWVNTITPISADWVTNRLREDPWGDSATHIIVYNGNILLVFKTLKYLKRASSSKNGPKWSAWYNCFSEGLIPEMDPWHWLIKSRGDVFLLSGMHWGSGDYWLFWLIHCTPTSGKQQLKLEGPFSALLSWVQFPSEISVSEKKESMVPGISEGQSARHRGQIVGHCKSWSLF